MPQYSELFKKPLVVVPCDLNDYPVPYCPDDEDNCPVQLVVVLDSRKKTKERESSNLSN